MGFENTATKHELKELKTELKGDIYELLKNFNKSDYQTSEVYDILKRFKENDILSLQKEFRFLRRR